LIASPRSGHTAKPRVASDSERTLGGVPPAGTLKGFHSATPTDLHCVTPSA
jgi:hypothetical protein